MTIPDISALQTVILAALTSGSLSGPELRQLLAKEHKYGKSDVAFYRLMMRIEDAGFVKGWYEQRVIDGQAIKVRHYKITGAGVRALNGVKAFYRTTFGLGPIAPIM